MTQPDGGMRWVIRIYLAIFLLYLLFPLVYMLLIAFNDSRIPTHRDFTFTLRWFGEAWADQRLWQGLRISVENPKGSTRRGKSPDGTEWENTMGAHYGYVKGSLAADGDHVDIFVGPAADRAPTVYVIDQVLHP